MINETGISKCNLDSEKCQNEPSNNKKLIKIAKNMLFKEVFVTWMAENNFEYDKEKDEGYNYCVWLKRIKRNVSLNDYDCGAKDILEEMSLTDIKTFFEDDLHEKFSETFLKEHICTDCIRQKVCHEKM